MSNSQTEEETPLCNAIRQILKKEDSCTQLCDKIYTRKVENTFFIETTTVYKLADVVEFEKELTLTSSTSEETCFIILGIEKMRSTVANRFLKKLEEPQAGVHFILTTNNESLVLPTIKSRCNQILRSQEKPTKIMDADPLVDFFMKKQTLKNATELDEILKDNPTDEITCKTKLEKIIDKSASCKNSQLKMKALSSALQMLPQSNFNNFWRNLFLQLI